MDDIRLREEIAFSVNFPLPFRVLFLGGLGILGWATNLHGLNALGIDAASALELSVHHPHRITNGPSAPDTPLPTARSGWKLVPHPATLYGPVYRLFLQYVTVAAFGWVCYRHATHEDVELVDVYKFIPGVLSLSLLMILVCPFDVFQKRERDKFLQYVSPSPRGALRVTDTRARDAAVRYGGVSSRRTAYILLMSCLRISSRRLRRCSGTCGCRRV